MPSLKQLQYFCALAKEENMSKLADKYFVSQTAFSNSISRLESEIGVKLFDRIGRRIILNEYGEKYLQYVQPALATIQAGQEAVAADFQKNSKTLCVALAGSNVWADMLHEFWRRYPQYSVIQKQCLIAPITEALPQLDVDLIVAGSVDFSSPYLCSMPFIQDRVILYVSPQHRLAKRKSIRLIEIKNEPFIGQPKGSGFRNFCNMLFEQAGFQPKTVVECDYSLHFELAYKGVGVAIATDSALRAHAFNNCVPIVIEDDFAKREMSCFWLKGRPLSIVAQKFIDFLLDYYKEPHRLL